MAEDPSRRPPTVVAEEPGPPGETAFRITERRRKDVTILELRGKLEVRKELERAANVLLREAFERVLDSGARKIVIDFAAVPRLDSSGLGELVRCHDLAGKRRAAIKLTRLNTTVREILRMTRLSAVFDTFADEAAAIASFGE